MITTMSNGTPADLAALVPHFRSVRQRGAQAGQATHYTFAIEPGWWSIVRRCHDDVVAAFPDYELLAVKQKYGVLAFQCFPRPWRPAETGH